MKGCNSTTIVKDKTGIIKQAAKQEEILEYASNTDTLDWLPTIRTAKKL